MEGASSVLSASLASSLYDLSSVRHASTTMWFVQLVQSTVSSANRLEIFTRAHVNSDLTSALSLGDAVTRTTPLAYVMQRL
jgi:hypothetical protein